ncbi:hypothetical protein [Brevibacillus sp. NRS-1366]|uniref:hypothetical protein n=1 Tax=Brevibacillus sp. NRS-1366 TaxID=3233899 RepID=UPI003D1FCDD5
MRLVDVLNQSYAYCKQAKWEEAARTMQTDALFVLDQEQAITGVVMRQNPGGLVSIGICAIDEIEKRDAEWDLYEQWAIVNNQRKSKDG